MVSRCISCCPVPAGVQQSAEKLLGLVAGGELVGEHVACRHGNLLGRRRALVLAGSHQGNQTPVRWRRNSRQRRRQRRRGRRQANHPREVRESKFAMTTRRSRELADVNWEVLAILVGLIGTVAVLAMWRPERAGSATFHAAAVGLGGRLLVAEAVALAALGAEPRDGSRAARPGLPLASRWPS